MTARRIEAVGRGARVRPAPGHDPEGHLTTGWEPHRPLADGLIRRFVFAYAASLAGPTAAMGGRVVQRTTHVAFDLGRPSDGFFTGIVLLQPLSSGGWEQTLVTAGHDLADGGDRSVLLWSPWPTPDLSVRGWQLVGHPPLLLRPTGGPAPPSPPWLRVTPVDTASTLADWEHVAVEGYPLDECRRARPGRLVDERLLDDPHWHGWVGYVDDTPVAIGTSYAVHGVNVFALGVTLPEHRGRGAWHALANRRLAAFPRLPAMSLFSDFSRRPAEGLGFLPLQRWTVWRRDRP
jgi:hypothetical protein